MPCFVKIEPAKDGAAEDNRKKKCLPFCDKKISHSTMDTLRAWRVWALVGE